MWNLLSELWVEYFIGEDWLTHCRLIYSYTFQRETKKKKDAMRAMGHPCCHLSMPYHRRARPHEKTNQYILSPGLAILLVIVLLAMLGLTYTCRCVHIIWMNLTAISLQGLVRSTRILGGHGDFIVNLVCMFLSM